MVSKDEIIEALLDASDTVLSWGVYAPEYFQEKHGLMIDVHKFSDFADRIKSEGIEPQSLSASDSADSL